MVRTGGPGKRLGMPLGFRRFPARLTVAMLGIVAVLSAARAPAESGMRAISWLIPTYPPVPRLEAIKELIAELSLRHIAHEAGLDPIGGNGLVTTNP